MNKKEDKNYNLSLGDFGPYNKEILGITHIADSNSGATFQVEIFPGLFRRRFVPANTDVKMWGANAELTHFCYRYELEWKDRLYCDVDYAISKDKRCDITCKFVNNTDVPQAVNVNLCASLQRPFVKYGKSFVKYKSFYTPILPANCFYRDAVDYDDIFSNVTLASDGKYICECERDFAVGKGTVVYTSAFTEQNHKIVYRYDGITASSLGLRLASAKTANLKIVINQKESHLLSVNDSDQFEYHVLYFTEQKVNIIEIYPYQTDAFIDAIVLGADAKNVEFAEVESNIAPIERTVAENSMTLRYENIPYTYKIQCSQAFQMTRTYQTDDIEAFLRKYNYNHFSRFISDRGSRIYESILPNPVFLEANESKEITFCITVDDGVEKESVSPFYSVKPNSDGKEYAFSQNMMMYNTFLNVVYPIYMRRQYIKHNTPGRHWDSLYTWDSGFIGMGLGCADFDRAFECLNTYLTPVGDKHSPFIFHGSVVPTQIFLFKYLFDKYPERRNELKAIFPMLKQYYRFFSGLKADEQQMDSGILKTWHIFYNSGGWDDYPAQDFLKENTQNGVLPNYDNTTPVITTAITVLISKILKNIALHFGEPTEEYQTCMDELTGVLQNGVWDSECGYFSYMVHDQNKMPNGFLRAADGSNYNQGFDGIYPYIAGATNEEQNIAIMKNIKEGLMTNVGVSVVDTRASYYSQTGYWNGMIWMPHQWILVQALFDYGEGELAFEIASKALNVWKNEVDTSYNCFEHFMPNGRGAGYHYFSGLSTPVLMFFESYYKPGTLTVGFKTSVTAVEWDFDKTKLTANLHVSGNKPIAIVCMNENYEYEWLVNGEKIIPKRITNGAYEIKLKEGDIRLVVSRNSN